MARHKNKLPQCGNCGFAFESANNYCPNCGQENHDIRLPLKHHMHEILEGLFHFDSKTLNSLKTLLWRPGRLSIEYNLGKRAPYVAPLRFYIFISFLFFLVHSLKPFHDQRQDVDTGLSMKFITRGDGISDSERPHLSQAELDSLRKFRTEVSVKELRGLTDEQVDALIKAKGMTDNWINRYIVHKFSKITRGEEEKMWHSIYKAISYSMFLLMPVFALVLMLFYRRKKSFYVENLTLSIHYHIFIFIILTVILFIGKFFPNVAGYGTMLAFALFPVYLFLMLQNYFGLGFFNTLIKVVLINILHFVLIVVFFIGSVLVSMVLI